MQTAFAHKAQRAKLIPCAAMIAAALLSLPGILGGCGTVPPPPAAITPAERIQRDQALGTEIARQLDSQFKFKQDRAVLIYLNGLAKILADATPELRSATVEVFVVQNRGPLWRDYSLPGHRIYLSQGLLKRMRFENQIAAAMAFEFAHILKRHVLIRLQEESIRNRKPPPGPPPRKSVAGAAPEDFPSIQGLVPTAPGGPNRPIEFLGPTGVYAFPDEFYITAAETAVEIMYRAGFDPRGLVSLWDVYGAQARHSPFDEDLLQKLVEKTRGVIALHPPLRNPIIRSQAFLAIQKRIQAL